MTDELVFDCLMCGTPLLIRKQDRNERLQCPICGEIMLSGEQGMELDPGDDYLDKVKHSPLSLLMYGPMLAVILLIAAAIFFFAVCYVVPYGL